jgi:hypothetical protein
MTSKHPSMQFLRKMNKLPAKEARSQLAETVMSANRKNGKTLLTKGKPECKNRARRGQKSKKGKIRKIQDY